MKSLPPVPNAFTSVVASRYFELNNPNNSKGLLLEVGAPLQDVVTVSGNDWRCPIRITEAGLEQVVSVCGVDSFQALHQAFRWVTAEVQRRERDTGLQLLFLGMPYDPETHLPQTNGSNPS
ncbi:DUF6968 family protein [Stutzerimonas stutzeri]|jgi:hypothetical protein|uniref:DUF6968 family protein n=1 Tax=Stutzerimonas stutzeri TaxID=316 RepID=UPI003C6FA3D1